MTQNKNSVADTLSAKYGFMGSAFLIFCGMNATGFVMTEMNNLTSVLGSTVLAEKVKNVSNLAGKITNIGEVLALKNAADNAHKR